MMKHLSSVILFLLILLGCSTPGEQHAQSVPGIPEISMDSVFHQYQMIGLVHRENLVTGKYDMETIGHWIRQGQLQDCEKEYSDILSNIKGGILYFKLRCASAEYYEKLKLKYPDVFTHPKPEVIEKLITYYQENNPLFKLEQEKSLHFILSEILDNGND